MARVALTSIGSKTIGPVGYGMLGLSIPWATTEYADAVKLLKTALGQGANFWYGPEDADKVVLSIKGAYNAATHTPDGSPEGIRKSVEEALRILDDVKKIDVFECARVDPKVPIETSVKALAQLVAEGKIGGIGLSEVSAEIIRRAHAVHPISAVEIELSLFTADVLTNGVADACHELGIVLVAYSPLSRGWLTGELRRFEDIPETDFRRFLPRFQPAVFNENLKLVETIEEIAKRKGATVAQVAMAWVRRQGAIPIPGSKKLERVVENCKDVSLDEDDLKEIQRILDSLPIQGQRYGGNNERLLN